MIFLPSFPFFFSRITDKQKTFPEWLRINMWPMPRPWCSQSTFRWPMTSSFFPGLTGSGISGLGSMTRIPNSGPSHFLDTGKRQKKLKHPSGPTQQEAKELESEWLRLQCTYPTTLPSSSSTAARVNELGATPVMLFSIAWAK